MARLHRPSLAACSPSRPAVRRVSTASAPAQSAQPPQTLAIVGAGLSGLSAAFYALRTLAPDARARTRVVLLEKEQRTGGWCRSVTLPLPPVHKENTTASAAAAAAPVGGRSLVFETGPRSIRPAGLPGWLTLELAHALNLSSSILTVPKSAPSARNRYLYYPTSLTLLPSSVLSAFTSVFTSPLMRSLVPPLLLEPFRPRPPASTADESVDAFFSRRFGKPLAETLASAMVHGIYAGDTRNLSVKALFPGLWDAEQESRSVLLSAMSRSLRRNSRNKSAYRRRIEWETQEEAALRARLSSTAAGAELVHQMQNASVWGFRGGIETLTNALRASCEAHGVELWVGDKGAVQSLEHTNDAWLIKTSTESLRATHLITTLPSLLSTPIPALSSAFTIPSTTVSVINLAFPATCAPLFPRGFGYLLPRTVGASHNPHHALGVIFDSDVMPDLDPTAGTLTKVTLILGGPYWADLAARPSPFPPSHDSLVHAALDTLRVHFPDTAFPTPVHTLSHTHHDCIPQIPVGHPAVFERACAELRALNESGPAKVAVVGGGTGLVGVNGATKAAWEVGTSFARSLEGRGDVKTGLEMWES